MRASILGWSTAGGALLGLLAGVVLFAAGVVVAVMLPAPAARALERMRTVGAVACFVVLPALGALLGYLEGRLKV